MAKDQLTKPTYQQSRKRFTAYCMLLGFFMCGGLFGIGACGPTNTEESCSRSEDCKRKGLCGLKENTSTCVAILDEDCRSSRFCADVGECVLEGDRCVAKKEEDCRNSTQCKTAKRCIPSGGECVEINPGYCRITNPRCKTHGECSLESRSNTCIAKTDDDCAASEICQNEGRCSYDGNAKVCSIKLESDCAGSKLCKVEGKCGLGGPESARVCIVRNNDDCQKSERCKNKEVSRCVFDTGNTETCVTGTAFCAREPECQDFGACTWSDVLKECIIGGESDCKKSQACKLAKRCNYKKENDISRCFDASQGECADSMECLQKGLCKQENKTCIAGVAADCTYSQECREQGRCKLSNKACVIDECTGDVCQVYGRCKKLVTKSKTSCVPSEEKDCQRSENCKRRGLCLKQGNVCVSGGTPLP